MSKPATPAPSALVERCVASEPLFEGAFLRAFRDQVALPDGSLAAREYVRHPGAVVVIAQADDGRYVVERQYRYPVQRVMLEFPAGKLDAGEDPFVCGQRELQEETGFRAREWAYAGAMHLAIAYSDEVIHIFFARGLVAGAQALDAGEFLEVELMTLADLLHAAQTGALTDAKSLSCLLWLQNVHAGTWALDWKTAGEGDSGA